MNNYVFTNTGGAANLQALQSRIRIFGIARTASGILAILFLLLTIFLFWKLGIGQAILERTGIAKKKSISQKQRLNAMSQRFTKSSAEKLAEQEFTGQLTGDPRKEKKTRKTMDTKNQKEPAIPPTEESATSVLSQQGNAGPQAGGKFVLTVNQIIIHTDEMIQEVNQ